MNDGTEDAAVLKKELDRVEGKLMPFGSFQGMPIRTLVLSNPSYLVYCLNTVPMTPKLRDEMLTALRDRKELLAASISRLDLGGVGRKTADETSASGEAQVADDAVEPARTFSTEIVSSAGTVALTGTASVSMLAVETPEKCHGVPTMSDESQMAATQTDDATVTTADLIAAYESGSALVASAVAGMTHEEMRLRPVAGRWSSLEVVCHIGDTEQFFADRMKRTLAMDRPLLIGADGWKYPDSVRYQDRDLEEELALVGITRSQMARILKLVPEEAWSRSAVHSESGLVTLRQLLLHAVRHLEHHVATIHAKRAALAGGAA